MKGKLIKNNTNYYIEYKTNDTSDDGFGLQGTNKYRVIIDFNIDYLLNKEIDFKLEDNIAILSL